MTNSTDELALDGPPGISSATGFFTILWRRKALVIFGLAVGMVAGLLYFLQKPPTYQSTAQLVVFRKKGEVLSNTTTTQSGMEDYVATQEVLLKSHETLKRAMQRLEKDPLRTPAPDNNIAGYIAGGLSVQRVKDANSGTNSNALTIAFACGDDNDCAKVVDAVIEGYKDWLKSAVEGDTITTIGLINVGIENKSAELQKNADLLDKVLAQHRDASPLSIGALSLRIGDYQRALQDLEIKRINTEERLALIQAAKESGKSVDTIKEIFRITDSRPQNIPTGTPSSARDYMIGIDLALAELKQRYGNAHQEVMTLMAKKAEVEKFFASQNKGFKSGQWSQPEMDAVDLCIEELKSQINAINNSAKRIQSNLDEDRMVFRKLDKNVAEETTLRDAITQDRKDLTDYKERKFRIDVQKDVPPYTASVITPPSTGNKIKPVLLTTLAVAGSIGLVLGGLLAYLAEAADKSFRTLEEVKTRLGVAVIGQVPPLPIHEPSVIEQNPLDPLLIVHHSPKSVEAEAYRGVRTSLYFSTRGKGHQVIQVTSPDQGDGKSTLVSNLAVAIAQSGRSVILIDADFRRPRVHKIFGLGKAETGLASVIAGESSLESAIYSCEVPGLSILPCGPRPTNPADLLTSALFQEILEEIKKDFDFVLIDTPPMLRCSDPSVVAPRVDGVILTIRMTKNSRPPAEQAKERLNILGANLLGVVVNGVDSLNRYGYGYGYGYAYAYGEVAYGDDFQESSTKLNKSR